MNKYIIILAVLLHSSSACLSIILEMLAGGQAGPSGLARPRCGSGWSAFGSHCYRLFEDELEWQDAEKHCRSVGGTLVSIHSQAEDNFIGGLSSERIWLGGNDITSEGAWTWSDGSAWNYNNWNSGEPNDAGGEDCAEKTSTTTWNDIPCTGHPRKFVCKK